MSRKSTSERAMNDVRVWGAPFARSITGCATLPYDPRKIGKNG